MAEIPKREREIAAYTQQLQHDAGELFTITVGNDISLIEKVVRFGVTPFAEIGTGGRAFYEILFRPVGLSKIRKIFLERLKKQLSGCTIAEVDGHHKIEFDVFDDQGNWKIQFGILQFFHR